MPKKIKRVKAPRGDVTSDSGYLLPSQGFKRNAGAYGNRGRAIIKKRKRDEVNQAAKRWNYYS